MDKWIALVKQKLRELGLSQEQLAERVGVTQGGVGHWLRGTRTPKVEMMNKVLVALGMPHLQVSLKIMPVTAVGERAGLYEGSAGESDVDSSGQYILSFRYPVLAWAELEGPLPLTSIVTEQTDYCAQGNAFWLRVEGDLMSSATGPSVPENMLVLVDPGVPAAPGKLVIARQAGTSAMFRQLVEDGGQRYLKPLNPTYPKLLCGEGFEVLGVVVRSHGMH